MHCHIKANKRLRQRTGSDLTESTSNTSLEQLEDSPSAINSSPGGEYSDRGADVGTTCNADENHPVHINIQRSCCTLTTRREDDEKNTKKQSLLVGRLNDDDTSIVPGIVSNAKANAEDTEEESSASKNKNACTLVLHESHFFRNCGLQTWLERRKAWGQTTVVDPPKRKKRVAMKSIVNGLAKGHRTHEFPAYVPLGDVICAFNGLWADN